MRLHAMAPYAALIGANLFFSGNYLLGGVAMSTMPLMSLMYIKWLVACIPMLLLAHFIEKPDWRVVLRSWKKIFMLGALGIAGYGFMFYQALSSTTPLNASLINAFNPALIAIASALFVGDRLSPEKLGGIAIAFCGVVWVLTGGHPTVLASQSLNPGDMWMIGVICCWTAYTIIARKGSEISPLSSCALQMTFFTLCMTPYAIFNGITLPSTSAAAWSMAYICVFPSAVAFFLWNYAAKHVDSGIAGQSLNLTVPFIAIMTLMAGGTVTSVDVIGGALVLSGVFLTLRAPKARRTAPQTAEAA
ncbi:DMT family transporter [Pseudomonas sp. LS-2]|uniref:DMT family transporter n=1 Tax=Pseudomonas sp. LS-2 TaxID=2315859 RepID=UPI000E70ECBA|nr:DMT family transporter [Pseudomonas sp. LS-2]RJX74866.1 DMT family transporter [Pseudomonas sp. LS-2]